MRKVTTRNVLLLIGMSALVLVAVARPALTKEATIAGCTTLHDGTDKTGPGAGHASLRRLRLLISIMRAIRKEAIGGLKQVLGATGLLLFRLRQLDLSFPKIISGRIDDAVRPRLEWRQ
jgi:hypothetical protein